MSNYEMVEFNTENPSFITYHGIDYQQINSEFLYNEEDLETIIEVMDLPQCELRTKKSQYNYKNIEHLVKNFDRQYDDTVVDTYAFDQVLKSDELTNIIYYFLYESDYGLEQELDHIKESIYSYVLLMVRQVYRRNNHKIVMEDIYYEYIDHLINRILAK